MQKGYNFFLFSSNYIFIRLMLIFLSIAPTCAPGKVLKIESLEIYPFGYIDSKGAPTGLIYDISNQIAQTAGYEYQNTLIPYPRLIKDLKSGTADFSIRYTNDELKTISIPRDEIIGFQTIIVGLKDTSFTKLEDLHGKTVGTIRSAHFDDQFNKSQKIIKVEFLDYDHSIKMLMKKRLDAVIGSDIGLNLAFIKNNIPASALGKPLKLQKKYFIIHYSKKTYSEEVAKDLTKAINKMKASGEFEKIVKLYRNKIN